ncbi:MAG: hypothetical protein KDA84_04155, partial [Planctomycetaceae bacterium]|nr:hypothetical protein [Planctomycetaceae bacterium]
MPDSPFESSEPLPNDEFPQSAEPLLSGEIEIVQPGRTRLTLPQPGLLLAIGIVFGILLIHGVTAFFTLWMIEPSVFSQPIGSDTALTERLTPQQLVQMLGIDQGVFVLLAFLGTWWVFGKRFGQVIPLRLPPMRHVALIFLLVLPLAVMDGFIAQQVIDIGETVFGITPSQGYLPELL